MKADSDGYQGGLNRLGVEETRKGKGNLGGGFSAARRINSPRRWRQSSQRNLHGIEKRNSINKDSEALSPRRDLEPEERERLPGNTHLTRRVTVPASRFLAAAAAAGGEDGWWRVRKGVKRGQHGNKAALLPLATLYLPSLLLLPFLH